MTVAAVPTHFHMISQDIDLIEVLFMNGVKSRIADNTAEGKLSLWVGEGNGPLYVYEETETPMPRLVAALGGIMNMGIQYHGSESADVNPNQPIAEGDDKTVPMPAGRRTRPIHLPDGSSV